MSTENVLDQVERLQTAVVQEDRDSMRKALSELQDEYEAVREEENIELGRYRSLKRNVDLTSNQFESISIFESQLVGTSLARASTMAGTEAYLSDPSGTSANDLSEPLEGLLNKEHELHESRQNLDENVPTEAVPPSVCVAAFGFNSGSAGYTESATVSLALRNVGLIQAKGVSTIVKAPTLDGDETVDVGSLEAGSEQEFEFEIPATQPGELMARVVVESANAGATNARSSIPVYTKLDYLENVQDIETGLINRVKEAAEGNPKPIIRKFRASRDAVGRAVEAIEQDQSDVDDHITTSMNQLGALLNSIQDSNQDNQKTNDNNKKGKNSNKKDKGDASKKSQENNRPAELSDDLRQSVTTGVKNAIDLLSKAKTIPVHTE